MTTREPSFRGGQLSLRSLEAIHRALSIDGDVVFKQTTASTNDDAGELARQGAPEGTLVVAEHQTSGKGRLGRRWQDRQGQDLLFSLVLRPRFERARWPALTAVAAIAVVEAMDECCGLSGAIKWPNDVFHDGRKLAGVLVETGTNHAGAPFAIVGLGINAGSQAAFDDAASLGGAAGRSVDRTQLLGVVLSRFFADYHALARGDTRSLEDRWTRYSATLGKAITVDAAGETVTGCVTDVTLAGTLSIRPDDGSVRVLRGEHVTVLEHP